MRLFWIYHNFCDISPEHEKDEPANTYSLQCPEYVLYCNNGKGVGVGGEEHTLRWFLFCLFVFQMTESDLILKLVFPSLCNKLIHLVNSSAWLFEDA